MRILFSLLFIVVATLFALSDSALLQRASTYLQSKSKSDVFRAYNDYKNLYLRAIMAENNALKQKALQGIVKSGHILHIDVATYEKELKKSQPKTRYNKPTPKPLKQSKKLKQIKANITNKLKMIAWDDEELVLYFSKPLGKKDVNFFRLYNGKKNIYKYVFDIHASLQTSQRLTKKGVKSIKISQYKLNTVRLVFANDNVLKVRYSIESNELHINVFKPLHKKTSSSAVNYYIGKKVIVIDPGHGGKDPGAIGFDKYKEKDIVLKIAKYLKEYLQARGYKVYLTRSGDRFIKLSHRTKFANKKKADLFISIHANASRNEKAVGIETYFLSPSRSDRAKRVAAMENKADVEEMSVYGKQSFLMFMNNHKIVASNKLAIDLQRSMLLELRKHYKDIVDGAVREGPFWVLVGAQMPAVLIEVGFITNKDEVKRLISRLYQKRIAKGIANGVDQYFINKNR